MEELIAKRQFRAYTPVAYVNLPLIAMMMISEVAPARYLLLFCFIYPLFYWKADAENVPGNQGGLSDEDTSQFHDKMANERKWVQR